MAGQHRDQPTTAGRDGRVDVPRLRRALGIGTATGIVSAVPLWKIPRKPLALWSGGIAAAVATGALILKRDQYEREAEVQGDARTEVSRARRLGAPVATGVIFGGFMAGSMWLTSVTDEWSEKLIARLGAPRPRATYAVLAGVGTALVDYFDEKGEPRGKKA
ncbi:hypothetical protein [Citricoccus sp.]|uniref:hypothetical protein n=1 Tax=Citricoccus sp. TaxID=1978372 RepID=UPI0028BDAC30|nr:hypothetical protein [Citricoccus sp.]